MSRLHRFGLLTKEQLANSPSRADGVPENMEQRRRKLAAQHMRDVCFKFQLRITTWAIAVTFFNRFYARKSMKKNQSFIMASASLFLACKVNDEPFGHQQLTNELLKAWFGKDNPQLHALAAAAAPPAGGRGPQQRHPQADFFPTTYAAVLEAERALLYTVGFDFNIEVLHTHVARLLNRPRFKAMGLQTHFDFQQKLISISNDIYHRDGLLMLEYPAEKVALAVYYIVFKSAKAVKSDNIPQPQQEPDGKPWYISEGLSTAECMELTTRFADKLYGGGGKARGDGGGAAGAASRPAPSVAGAASTAMLGACESAAYSGGGPTLGVAPGRSDLLSDGPGEHTSVPRPLGSDVASGSKRPADGPPAHSGASPSPASFTPAAEDDVSGHPAKRARQEPAAPSCNNEATSSAAAHPSAPLAARPPAAAAPRGPAHGPSRFAAPPPAVVVQHAAQHAPPRAAPAPAAAAQPPAQHAVPPPAAADANSEKEEGELEDGELSLVDFAD